MTKMMMKKTTKKKKEEVSGERKLAAAAGATIKKHTHASQALLSFGFFFSFLKQNVKRRQAHCRLCLGIIADCPHSGSGRLKAEIIHGAPVRYCAAGVAPCCGADLLFDPP
jgi:hypothetical protein